MIRLTLLEGRRQMMPAAFALLVVFALPIAVASQVMSPAPGTPAAAPGAPTVAGSVFTDPASPIRTRIGQYFLIALEANRTTGFTWELVPPSDARVQTVGSSYAVAHSARLGAGGEQIWIVRAASAGKTRLTFRYIRPFDKTTVSGAKHVTFEVEIAP